MVDFGLGKILVPSVLIVLGITVSMHKRSYDAVSGAAQQLLQQDLFLFTPTRLEAAVTTTLGGGVGAKSFVANDSPKEQQQEDDEDEEVDTEWKHIPRNPTNGKPLNVVVMYGDDWRHDAIGVASNGVVETPFIDWLSRNKGMRFTHNCVSTSICWISRATLHTGQYYSRHGATNPGNEEWYEGFHEAFPALLNKAGYFVSHIGKSISRRFSY